VNQGEPGGGEGSKSHVVNGLAILAYSRFSLLTTGSAVRVRLPEPKKSCANRSTVWFTESPGGLTAGAFVYKGQESRPFALTAAREHRPPGSRCSTAEITLRGARHPSQPRSCSLRQRAGTEHGPLVYTTRVGGCLVYTDH
jgi:hypothetical protein